MCQHSHPTIRAFASHVLFKSSEKLEYSGDPLLDFSLSNFLDRIAFKEPKSEAKLAKFVERQRKMSEYSQPLNQVAWSEGEKNKRADEEYIV